MARSSERGMAMVIALFLVLVLSVLGSALVFVSRTEALSSLNYKTMSQTRYGAESGVHRVANHLLGAYVPPTPAQLPLYNIDVMPVRVVANGRPVVLGLTAATSNYPDAAQVDAFVNIAQGTLVADNGTTRYSGTATLLKMRQIPDPFLPGQTVTLQTWEITGTGNVGGAGSASVEVSAIIERQAVPIFKYAAFATDPGCVALKFGGGATTNSYDSKLYNGVGVPAVDNYGSNVGTNGNMTEIGNTTTVHGSLSTPRTGVGACNGGNGGNVPALTASGGATVDGGIIELPQAVTFPTPPEPNPLPPTGNQNFNNACPFGAGCAYSGATNTFTLDPAATGGTMTLADMRVGANKIVRLKPGVYIMNSIAFQGGATIVIDVDPAQPAQQVIFRVAGVGVNTPIDFTGGSITNTTYDPARFQILYAGTGNMKLVGGAGSAVLAYAPNASTSFAGGGDFYGAVVSGTITDMGGASIHYDRSLQKRTLMGGNPTMGSFTWKAD